MKQSELKFVKKKTSLLGLTTFISNWAPTIFKPVSKDETVQTEICHMREKEIAFPYNVFPIYSKMLFMVTSMIHH